MIRKGYCYKREGKRVEHAWVDGQTPDIMTCARCLETTHWELVAPKEEIDAKPPNKPRRSMNWLYEQLPRVP